MPGPESQQEPTVEIVKRAEPSGLRVGVFASSFNPITVAHIELVRRAAAAFSLDEMLALAGRSNADKTTYDCSLEDRLHMVELAFSDEPQVSIGVSSHAFYVDMVEALGLLYPMSDLHFVVGFDTFERVLDPDDRYTARYHRPFASRQEALRFLIERCRFVVAGRSGAGAEQVNRLLAAEPPKLRAAVSFLDFPPDLGERSSTEVRDRRRRGESIEGLVPENVEEFILARRLYE